MRAPCDIHVSAHIKRHQRPDVKFFCDLDYDPFLIMQDQKKLYGASFSLSPLTSYSFCYYSGFTVSLYEYEATIPTLWNAVKGALSVIYMHTAAPHHILAQSSSMPTLGS